MEIASLIYQEGWKPTSDTEITQLMKYLKEKQKETDRIVNTAREEITEIETIAKEAEDKQLKLTEKIESLCMEYVLNEVEEEDRKETATQIKYKIARGEIVINKEKKEFGKPSEMDETYLSADFPEFVKSEPKFKWGDFKKELEITENGKVVHKSTGKVIENVPVIETQKTVKVKLK